jgi:membrane glycosyltransferase
MHDRPSQAGPGGAKTPPTAPPIERSSMRPVPWFGLARGLLLSCWRLTPTRAATPARADWEPAGRRRRAVLLAIVGALACTAAMLQLDAVPEGGFDAAWVAHAALATLLFAWVGSGFVTALMGMWVMLRGDAHGLTPRDPGTPIARLARTALVMPICNEDVDTVAGGLRATCASLAATGTLSLFDIYLLSDTSDPALRAAELRAWEQLRADLGDAPVEAGGRVFYRWRRRRTHRKAGNVADFCRRWGRRYRYMIVLDADSTMSGDTLVALVRLMEEHPRAGVVQTMPQSHGQATLHARLQQFANRVTGRLFALGMAYWQLGESHYWGHNAILRVEPFMRHCALAPIPGRGGLAGSILSHDFVEAAMMRRAGYEVWLAPQLGGSFEQHPPNLLAELQRDRRWCHGNLQNARLIAEPGWRPVHRAMFLVGALSYLTAPLWIAFVGLGLLAGEDARGSPLLWGLTLLLLFLPRVLGVLATLLRGGRVPHGGSLRLVASALLEGTLSVIQAPLRMVAHTGFVIAALTGLRLEWKSPPRNAGAVRWGDTAARFGPYSLLALSALLLLAARSGDARLPTHLLPVLLPLLLAVPFAVLTGDPRAGTVLQRLGLLGAEDHSRPASAPAGAIAPAPAGLPRHDRTAHGQRPMWRPGPARALATFVGVATMLFAVIVPDVAHAPGGRPQEDQTVLASVSTAIEHRTRPLLAEATMPRSPMRARAVPYRPARMIDDALRRRAYEAVQRALEQAQEAPV